MKSSNFNVFLGLIVDCDGTHKLYKVNVTHS